MFSRIRHLIHRWICPPVPTPQGPSGTLSLFGLDGALIVREAVALHGLELSTWKGRAALAAADGGCACRFAAAPGTYPEECRMCRHPYHGLALCGAAAADGDDE